MFLDLLRVRLPQAAPRLAGIAVLIGLGLAYRRVRARRPPASVDRIDPV